MERGKWKADGRRQPPPFDTVDKRARNFLRALPVSIAPATEMIWRERNEFESLALGASLATLT
jgi:hypothetical protein